MQAGDVKKLAPVFMPSYFGDEITKLSQNYHFLQKCRNHNLPTGRGGWRIDFGAFFRLGGLVTTTSTPVSA
jgi:hypothetical protein